MKIIMPKLQPPCKRCPWLKKIDELHATCLRLECKWLEAKVQAAENSKRSERAGRSGNAGQQTLPER